MKKKIANILTISRIVISTILLFFFDEISTIFIILFSVGIFTDLIDGAIARKTGSVSIVGSVLDTIADTLLAINIFKVIYLEDKLTPGLTAWLVINLAFALIMIIVTKIKFKRAFFVHSIFAKILGGVVYFLPFGIYFDFYKVHIIIVLAVFSITMVENIMIAVFLKKPDSDARSLLSVIKLNYANGSNKVQTNTDSVIKFT